ncbi:MAG TPA: hypothetical protein VFJ12_14660 [Segeticoccus sp.]|nr:hypothetical protein [Segeticoccus sp.]
MSPQQYPVRRAPSFAAFIGTGAVLGFLAGALVSALGPATPQYSGGSTLMFLGVGGAVLGALAAGVVAVVLDHRSVQQVERARRELEQEHEQQGEDGPPGRAHGIPAEDEGHPPAS